MTNTFDKIPIAITIMNSELYNDYRQQHNSPVNYSIAVVYHFHCFVQDAILNSFKCLYRIPLNLVYLNCGNSLYFNDRTNTANVNCVLFSLWSYIGSYRYMQNVVSLAYVKLKCVYLNWDLKSIIHILFVFCILGYIS